MGATCDTCGFLAQGEADYDTHDKYEDHPFTSDEMETVHVMRVRDFGNGTYQATCSLCGKVGVVDAFRDDVQAIADRHALVGGFES